VSGCFYTFKPNQSITSPWRSKYDDQYISLYGGGFYPFWLYAFEQISLEGTDINGDPCVITDGPQLFNEMSTNIDLEMLIPQDTGTERYIPGEHKKPRYVEVEDPITGLSSQINIGGHSHHQNKCNNTYRTEKLEFLASSQNCESDAFDDNAEYDSGITTEQPEDEESEIEMNPCDVQTQGVQCATNTCGQWATCGCTGLPSNQCCLCLDRGYNTHNLEHGIIKWEKGVLYYASIVPPGDPNNIPSGINSNSQYKGNLLLPTDITELGSSVFCDIDESPFIMDQLPPTTFQISEEAININQSNSGTGLSGDPYTVTTRDKPNSKINISNYVSFSCILTKCVNTNAVVNGSQIGVDMIDANDAELEIGPCKIIFDHDVDLREYFCKRFSGYKNADLQVNYQRPGSTEFENIYNHYPEGPMNPTTIEYYEVDGGPVEANTLNDGDDIIPGDRCGINYTTSVGTPLPTDPGDVDYFYGLAPGYTMGMDAFSPHFPTRVDYNGWFTSTPSINIDHDDSKGINFGTSQTPYYFYFGIVPGKTALHKSVSKYFADKINKVTLEGLGNNKSSENLHNKTNFRNNIKNPISVLKSCLGEKIILPDDE